MSFHAWKVVKMMNMLRGHHSNTSPKMLGYPEEGLNLTVVTLLGLLMKLPRSCAGMHRNGQSGLNPTIL